MTAQYLRTQAKRMAAAYQPPATDGIRKPSPDMCLTVYGVDPTPPPRENLESLARRAARGPKAAEVVDMLGLTEIATDLGLDLGVA